MMLDPRSTMTPVSSRVPHCRWKFSPASAGRETCRGYVCHVGRPHEPNAARLSSVRRLQDALGSLLRTILNSGDRLASVLHELSMSNAAS